MASSEKLSDNLDTTENKGEIVIPSEIQLAKLSINDILSNEARSTEVRDNTGRLTNPTTEIRDEAENLTIQLADSIIDKRSSTSSSNIIVIPESKSWEPSQPLIIRCFCGRRHGLKHTITIIKCANIAMKNINPLFHLCPCGINFTTPNVIGIKYYDLVEKRSNSHQKVIVGPLKTVLDENKHQGLNYWKEKFQGSIDELNSLISQNGLKNSYNYLFLRPPQNNIEITELTLYQIVDLVFYIGKGTSKRLTDHIAQIRRAVKSEINTEEKIDIIDRLWFEKKYFHIVKIFDKITLSESNFRESTIISAIGRNNLSNIIDGVKIELSEQEIQECGTYYLLEALEESKHKNQWQDVYQGKTHERK